MRGEAAAQRAEPGAGMVCVERCERQQIGGCALGAGMVLSMPPAAQNKRERSSKPRWLTAAGFCFGHECRRREIWTGSLLRWEARRGVFIWREDGCAFESIRGI